MHSLSLMEGRVNKRCVERFAAHLGSLVVAMRGLLLLLALAAGARYIQTLYFFLLLLFGKEVRMLGLNLSPKWPLGSKNVLGPI